MDKTSNVRYSPFRLTAKWFFRQVYGREPSKQVLRIWEKELCKIGTETEANYRDRYLVESVISYALFDQVFKKIRSPKQLKSKFEKIADKACEFIGDDILCQTAAVLAVYGGEYTVYNLSFRMYLPLFKWRFRFSGGRTPIREGVVLVNKKIYELERYGNKCEWFKDFYKEALHKDSILEEENFLPIDENFRISK